MNADEDIRTDELVRVIQHEHTPKDEQLKDIIPTPRNYQKFNGEKQNALPKGIVWGLVGIVAIFVIGFIASFFLIKQKINSGIPSQVATLQAGVNELQNFDLSSARQSFSSLSVTSTPSFQNIVDMFGFLFKGSSATVTSLTGLTQQFLALSNELSSLQINVFGFIGNGQGAATIATLSNLHNTLSLIDGDGATLSGIVSADNNFYLPLKTQIESGEQFLNALLPWFSNPTPHHVLLLFPSPSEMRPGGGFLGTYADVTIANGIIVNIAVHNTSDVDAAFHQSIIPPQPLQATTKSFRPVDANWFFDYPTSASETIHFFETSNLYAGSTTFDGAITFSPQVMSDLLSVTGPMSVASTTFTAQNFFSQMQSLAQHSQATSATYPPTIFTQLSEAVFADLASSTDAQKNQVLSLASNWITNKDVMVYFKDPQFENFFASYGATGDVYQVPQNFNGDYLAIVGANVYANVSDASTTEKVALDTQINADGTISDDLTIYTINAAATTNQNYLQLFITDGSSLTNETGGVQKTIPAPLPYQKDGYSTDPVVALIQSSTQQIFGYPAVTTHEESGKEVFATWTRAPAHASTTIEFDYTHRAFVPPADGVAYQFVFEKQPGTNRSYDFEIDAPLGYAFKETNLATYEYTSHDPPGRLIINLTLEKI